MFLDVYVQCRGTPSYRYFVSRVGTKGSRGGDGYMTSELNSSAGVVKYPHLMSTANIQISYDITYKLLNITCGKTSFDLLELLL